MKTAASMRFVAPWMRGDSPCLNEVHGALAVFVLLALAGAAQAQERTEPTLTRGSWPEAAPHDDWSARIAADLQQAEYRFSELGPGLFSAPNRAHELRVRVSAEGLEVFPRAAGASGEDRPWRLELRTRSFGREGALLELDSPAAGASATRAQLDYGLLCEWFENRNAGIEQGWTISQRPPGTGPLWLGLEFAGGLSLRIEEGARAGVLSDGSGEPRLRYSGLRAFDAAQRELDARLLAREGGVGIEVDDAGATYPLTIDPLLTGPAWTVEGDQAGASLGWAVAAAGDVNGDGFSDVLVGAKDFDAGEVDEGRAYLYLGSAAGLATSAAWTAEGNQAGAYLGAALATAGDVNGDGYGDVIVGAYGYDSVHLDAGRALVFLGSASGLDKNAAWMAESDKAVSSFGWSVATAGDANADGYSDVIIGAVTYANGQNGEGRAFVYLGSASGLAASAVWTTEGNQVNALYGQAVSTAGDVNGDGYDDVIVGARMFQHPEAHEGAAFLYLGSPTGPEQALAWFGEGNQAGAFYGWSVAPAGDVNGDGYADVLVGAIVFDGVQLDSGRAYLYQGTPFGLESAAAWTADGDQAYEHFARSLATAGDVNGDGYGDVIVGAEWFANGEAEEGGAFVYLGSASGLDPTAAWSAEGDQDGARFGYSVCGAGDVNGDGYGDVLVGAYQYDGGEVDEGRASGFLGSAQGLARDPDWTSAGDQAGAGLGISLASAGDVNGDGYGDVIVGADGYDNGQSDEGRALVYLGSAAGLTPSAAWTAEGNQSGSAFGWSVSAAGDVNGDGYGDVIVGALLYDNGQSNEGRAFLYLGSAAGLAASPAWSTEPNQVNALFGQCVAAAGDVNGDGYGDVIVGARTFFVGQPNEGAAFVFLGSPGGLASSPAWFGESNQAGAFYGWSVAGAGDVNADGYGDVIVGALLYDGAQRDTGRAFVYQGSAGGLAPNAAWTADGPQAFAHFGVSVAGAGDVNGDGYSDVITGAEWYENGEAQEGGAFAYLGSASGLAPVAAWTAESDQVDARFGFSVASAGDVNGDGYSDVLVGAYLYDAGEADEGRAFAYLGSAVGLAPVAAWTAESDQVASSFGRSAAPAGDVNGDGYADVLVGAEAFDDGQTDEGRALVFLGNDGRGGRVNALQQRRKDDSAPLALLGRTGPNGLFRIRAEFAKNLAGSSWASPALPTAFLEWEVQPLGTPFDGTSIERSLGQALEPAGGTLSFDELAVIDDGPSKVRWPGVRSYHWRARIATNNPLFPHTGWFSLPGNNITEAKLRKPAVPLR